MIRLSMRQRSQIRDVTTHLVTAAIVFALLAPVVAIVIGLSIRIGRWVAG